MIAKLCGLLDSIGDGQAIIDVGGVGYLVFCSSRTLGLMPARGHSVSLQIETHVREDHIHLYGFASDAERDWFRTLTTVQGVGAKVALSILGTLAPLELAQAIVAGDRATVSRADGVGPKLAQRIVTELKDKAAIVGLRSGVQSEIPAGAVTGAAIEGELADAVSALVNLGYRRVDAFSAVSNASRRLGGDAVIGDLIRAGLKELGGPT